MIHHTEYKMSDNIDNILDDVVSQEKAVIYTKPCQLPANIAFQMQKWNMTESKFQKGKFTSQCTVKMDQFVNLLVYPGTKYENVPADKLATINKAIADGHDWYLVARHYTSVDRVPVDIMPASRKQAQNLPTFDCSVHEILKLDAEGNLISGKKNEAGSPTKKFKREYNN